jgi:hypothetical protein
MSTSATTLARPLPSVRVQTLATIAAIVGAVTVPQLFHVAGATLGLGTALGETFLPMHLPIILVGLLAGPYAGLIAGIFGPLASFAASGMPGTGMLPFMMIELGTYGLVAGLLRPAKAPTVGKVLITQVAGRLVRAAAILVAVLALGNQAIAVSAIWTSVAVGLPGLILQWALLPLVVRLVDKAQGTSLEG